MTTAPESAAHTEVRHVEAWLVEQGAAMSYALILEANSPSIKLFEGQGFRRHPSVELFVMLVYKEMEVPAAGLVRPIQPADYVAVADLLDRTWRDHDLYEPVSADAVARLLARLPALDLGDTLVLEDAWEVGSTR